MRGLNTTTRLSIGLTGVTISILFIARMAGLISNPQTQALENRVKLCESLATQFSMNLRNDQFDNLRNAATILVKRIPDFQSIAVQRFDGKYLIATKGHKSLWKSMPKDESTATHVKIPMFRGEKQWGTIQICFEIIEMKGIKGFLSYPELQLSIFLAVIGLPMYWFYLRRTLRHLNPSKVIPERVNAIIDTLSEGVMILDENNQIVMVNSSFGTAVGRLPEKLQGIKATEINWEWPQDNDKDKENREYPWSSAIREGKSQKGSTMNIRSDDNKLLTYMVNTSPIRTPKGQIRGTLATFDDVTEIEEKNTKLEHSLGSLKESRNKIKEQNEELKQLASRDPLTGCLNRRAFFERLDAEWSGVKRHGYPLGYIMIDADHFKSVNDIHGHAVGDQVLKSISEVLIKSARKTDSVCRYGGEEFCILMPQTDIVGACAAAEIIRQKIEATKPAGLTITVSIGASAHELGATNSQMMLEEADQALYAAKDTGRNKVVRFDEMPEVSPDQKEQGVTEQKTETKKVVIKQTQDIPFSAVTALFSALEHRDINTAIHSRKVANLCVMMAKGLISGGDCFILEIAGLLHDIGKLGVPDSILLKPGPLTSEERDIMDTHDRMGVEIVNASFGSPELTNIIRFGHAQFGGNSDDSSMPTGNDIPLRSRIVLIADAYDAMTTDRVYRKAMSQADAFEELRRCAGTQFDPELVPQFIDRVLARDENRSIDPLPASQVKALEIGLEIERLACAMEEHDIGLLAAITENIIESATSFEMPEIADLALNIKEAATTDQDTKKLMEITNDLLNQCQSYQQHLIEAPDIMAN